MANYGPYGGSAHKIPGRIQIEDFDLGGEGGAYHDETASNEGGAYRDTAVDIESTSDTSGAYNVGWVEDTEWLEYTVDVEDGSYDIHIRVASNTSGGRLRILLDGTEIASTEITGTGGWQNWTTVTVSDISISGSSDSVLRLEFSTSNSYAYNLNWIEFDQQSTSQDRSGDTSAADVIEEHVFLGIEGSLTAVPVEIQDGFSIISKTPSNVTDTSATLNGELTGTLTDDQVDVWFVYAKAGEDPPFFTTPTQSLGSTGSFSADITGLEAATEYEFWAVVQTSTEKLSGKDKVFSTT